MCCCKIPSVTEIEVDLSALWIKSVSLHGWLPPITRWIWWLWVVSGVAKSFCLKFVIVHSRNLYVMGCICLGIWKDDISTCITFSRLPMIAITFWFKAYSRKKNFFSLLALWDGFLSWEEILFLITFFQQHWKSHCLNIQL